MARRTIAVFACLSSQSKTGESMREDAGKGLVSGVCVCGPRTTGEDEIDTCPTKQISTIRNNLDIHFGISLKEKKEESFFYYDYYFIIIIITTFFFPPLPTNIANLLRV